MYSGLRYLSHPAMSDRSHHSKVSGGFPHSDIHGSKPIPGSPWLNAGYHVLHRLLLPRHPPNALFALDLIQKEQGPTAEAVKPNAEQRSTVFPVVAAWNGHVSKAVLTHITGWFARRCLLVSVLDLEQYRFSGRSCDPPSVSPHAGSPAILMFLSKRCQFPSSRTSQHFRWKS